jgi:hypothetical protein
MSCVLFTVKLISTLMPPNPKSNNCGCSFLKTHKRKTMFSEIFKILNVTRENGD